MILHEDHSDPIVSVAIQYHVGSSREVPGRTGFAHLFEHMMFQESENVGQDQFFKKIQSAGGTLNRGTNSDGTIHFEVVPKNALELVLWLESDRMGYMINTNNEGHPKTSIIKCYATDYLCLAYKSLLAKIFSEEWVYRVRRGAGKPDNARNRCAPPIKHSPHASVYLIGPKR